jgi:homoserine O-acetyltransferase
VSADLAGATVTSSGVRRSPAETLLNPEWEPLEAARSIRDVRTITINPESITGHAGAGGFLPADVELINLEVGRFLDVVTQRGEKLK